MKENLDYNSICGLVCKTYFKSIENHWVCEVSHFEIGDEKFSLLVYKDEICLWANDGRTSLKTIRYDSKIGLTTKEIEEVFERINNWMNGYILCTDCGKLIKKEEVAGHYFAGSYCKDCWEGKWKEIEANETYD